MSDYIDLHTHTTASDGTYSPTELVELAKKTDLKAIAITDHDTINGVSEAIGAGESLGVEVIAGTELSIEYPLPENGHMHLLGLFVDIHNPELITGLEYLRKKRDERTPKILKILNEHGISISEDEVLQEAGEGSVGRPHIARIMLKKGYVNSIKEAFERYLKKGAIAYVPKEKFEISHAINLILKAGGIPILAHPVTLKLPEEELKSHVERLMSIGLKGIEVFYSTHTEQDTITYLRLANELGLLISGGTDFHGKNKPDIRLGTGKGNLHIPYSLVEGLKKSLEN